jgi:hypothetical protein
MLSDHNGNKLGTRNRKVFEISSPGIWKLPKHAQAKRKTERENRKHSESI